MGLLCSAILAGHSARSQRATQQQSQQSQYVGKKLKRKLSKAGIETLTIIAYYQPVTRAEIEKVRGRNLSRGTLDRLLERGWIELKGRRQTPGQPLTWGTTDKFLEHFNLSNLKDLPTISEINKIGLEEKS